MVDDKILQSEFNARLIAAAPDLLAALRFCVPLLQRDANRDHGDQQLTAAAEERLQFARAALAKAEGT